MLLNTPSEEHRTLSVARWAAAIPVIAALVLGFLLLGGPAAQAHDELTKADPAQDATVQSAPDHVTLSFSGDITNVQGGNKIIVTDADGKTVSTGDATVEGKEVTQKMSSDAGDGTYTVAWRVVSQDGHPVEGKYSFTVGKGSSGEASSSAGSSASGAQDNGASASQAPAADEQNDHEGLPVWVSAVMGAAVAAAVVAVIALLLARRRGNRRDEDRREDGER